MLALLFFLGLMALGYAWLKLAEFLSAVMNKVFSDLFFRYNHSDRIRTPTRYGDDGISLAIPIAQAIRTSQRLDTS